MKEQKKKKVIAALLLISCFISGYLLIFSSSGGSKRLQNIAQADSLIQQELDDFNIDEQQIRISTTQVDSNFSRKTYHIGVPYEFSKTQFHAELNRRFHEYTVQTPAKVTFPEQNVDIHLLYRGTVIRTLSLQTDPELEITQNKISILVTFDESPDDEVITQLASLGEPISVVIKIDNPMDANDLKKQVNYDRIIFWLQDGNGENLLAANPGTAISKLKQLNNVLPEAHILQLQQVGQTQQQIISKTNLTFINAANALLLDEEMGKTAFMEELNSMHAKPEQSIAIISGSSTTISWLQEKLPDLKKSGIDLVPPPQTNF